MPEKTVKCLDVRDALVKSAMSSFTDDSLHAGIRAHLQGCEPCRLYAEGLRMAPMIFGGESLYSPFLKRRCMSATAGPAGSGDLKLGLLIGLPASVSLILSFLLQVYLVRQTLAKAINSDAVSWVLSLASVWTVGVAAGAICLAALITEHMRSHRLQEVLHD